jgi:hypothetical protein
MVSMAIGCGARRGGRGDQEPRLRGSKYGGQRVGCGEGPHTVTNQVAVPPVRFLW